MILREIIELSESGYECFFLQAADLPEIMRLQQLAAENAPEGFFSPMPEAYVAKQLNEAQNCIGVFAEKELVGVHIISFPQEGEENFGADVGLASLSGIAHLGAVAIHPKHCGKGLHARVGDFHLAAIRRLGYRHILATVAPENYCSLRFLTARGFRVRRLCTKYGSYLRFVVHLDLTKHEDRSKDAINVHCRELAMMKKLLEQGYQGSTVEKRGADVFINFVR